MISFGHVKSENEMNCRSPLACHLNRMSRWLKTVNIGEDTDITGAATGGLAGLHYGYDQIPKEWIDVLARREDIEDLGKRLASTITGKTD